jgi:hypothetical protein
LASSLGAKIAGAATLEAQDHEADAFLKGPANNLYTLYFYIAFAYL